MVTSPVPNPDPHPDPHPYPYPERVATMSGSGCGYGCGSVPDHFKKFEMYPESDPEYYFYQGGTKGKIFFQFFSNFF